ncbi:hypothetical protein GOODEAATRI_000454 [Goodea atripinnis]|uniref:Uncharacterized protein n=1 Tax=Goodea atripinnis TaxID=208336 RepID=A0ABV0NGD6_9TELE
MLTRADERRLRRWGGDGGANQSVICSGAAQANQRRRGRQIRRGRQHKKVFVGIKTLKWTDVSATHTHIKMRRSSFYSTPLSEPWVCVSARIVRIRLHRGCPAFSPAVVPTVSLSRFLPPGLNILLGKGLLIVVQWFFSSMCKTCNHRH